MKKPEKHTDTGERSIEMIARVLALKSLDVTGDLRLGYGEKGVLLEALGCSLPTLNRSLAVLDEAGKEAEILTDKVRQAQRSIGALSVIRKLEEIKQRKSADLRRSEKGEGYHAQTNKRPSANKRETQLF